MGLREKSSRGRKAGRCSLRPSPPRSRSPTLDVYYFSGQRPWAMWSWPNSRRNVREIHVQCQESQHSNIRRTNLLPEKQQETRLNPREPQSVGAESVRFFTAALLHPRRRSDSVAAGPTADSVYVGSKREGSLRLLCSSTWIVRSSQPAPLPGHNETPT